MPKVMIGAPVRNRAWVLPRFIEAIQKQTGLEIQTHFIVNDSEDDTEQILQDAGFHTETYNLGDRKTESEVRGKYNHVNNGQRSFANLAEVRNRLLDAFLASDCDYLFSVDTDIIIPEGSIQQLIEDDKDIVSMLLWNHPERLCFNIMKNDRAGVARHLYYKPPANTLIEGDVTGAVYLIKRRVIEAGVRYGDHTQGEDIYFSKEAKRLGFEIYCDTGLRPIHVFSKGADQELIAPVEGES